MPKNEYEQWIRSLGVNTITMLMNGERCGYVNQETGDVILRVGGVDYIMEEDKVPPEIVPFLLQIMEMESLIDNLSRDKDLVKYMRTPEQLEKEKARESEGPIIIEFDKDWWLKHGKARR
jgi:hypothetical protein